MPKYFCDYCDTYLTHDSPSVRKTHIGGRKHKDNVRLYYQKWLEDQVQRLVDDTTAAFKAGKIANNPFGGAMIPPPAGMGGPPVMGMRPPGMPILAGPPMMRPPMGMMMQPHPMGGTMSHGPHMGMRP